MTGLRRNEIASLTPLSFSLDSEMPTVTVEAAFSKHRRKDVLPLHPEFVLMLGEWLKGVPPDVPLFPGLAKRRTWYMVKTDLEAAGIEYETAEGIADFHAAGRHTHITELLRNGATLPQAKELARHSDVKMTMRYTHIGIEDQAKALKQLPWNSGSVKGATEKDDTANGSSQGRERNGSESGDRHRRTRSRNVVPKSECERPKHEEGLRNDGDCRTSSSAVRNGGTDLNSFDSRRLHFT